MEEKDKMEKTHPLKRRPRTYRNLYTLCLARLKEPTFWAKPPEPRAQRGKELLSEDVRDGSRDHPHAAGGAGIGVMTFMTIDAISNFITSLIVANDGSAMNSPILAMSVA